MRTLWELETEGEEFITDPLEGFASRIRLAGYTGLVLASPATHAARSPWS